MKNKLTLAKWIAIFIPIFVVMLLVTGVIGGVRSEPADLQTDPASDEARTRAEVVRVVDGDTVDVRIGGVKESVRLIGIDAPEIDWGRYNTNPTNADANDTNVNECCGWEAREALVGLLPVGSTVELRSDPTQDVRDKYDRILAYVFLDGENINERLIAEGAARERQFARRYALQESFESREQEARKMMIGLWGACVE